jgi:hypothetical protein
MAKAASKRAEKTASDTATHDHHDWVAEMAYYLAEKRGFAPGYELDDWLTAEGIRAGEA